MDHDGSMSRMLRMCEWVMRLAYTNLLWLLFTLLGLGIFGFMPATTALFSVMRKWIQGHEQVSVFQTFWKVYREEFVRSNVIGVVLVIIGTIIYVDLAYIYPTSWFYTCFALRSISLVSCLLSACFISFRCWLIMIGKSVFI